MGTLGKGYTFGATESVTNTKLHQLVDNGSVSGIVNADVAAGAAIDSTKLNLTSAGYLTTGGNFDVTGRYSFSNLSWFNTGSLASLANTRIQNMVLSSLASIADVNIQRALIPSLASIGEIRSPIAYITSLASIPTLRLINQINEFSTDGTLNDNSDTAVPTEKAVKTYADGLSQGLTLISATSMSAVNNSGDITISASKLYVIVIELSKATANQIKLRFNSDATGGNYQWGAEELNFAASPTNTTSGSASDSSVNIGVSDTADSSNFFCTIELNTVLRNSIHATVHYQGVQDDGTTYNHFDGSGVWIKNEAISNFEILTTGGTMTGNVYLYERDLTV